jgi:cytochrome c biogenesis protein CcmG/thiol:disulfide interchange protein DsbE
MRRALPLLAAVAIAALVVIGLTQAGGKAATSGGAAAPRFDLAQARAHLRGAPPELASLHAQASTLLAGGRGAFDRRLRALRGRPVVVNKWASWCGPCRAEFPFFESLATERGRKVAFVGVDARDAGPAATRFLKEFPLPYPSYVDPDEAIARSLKAPQNFPITVFLDASGRTAFIHQGGYTSRAALAADVDRYLG